MKQVRLKSVDGVELAGKFFIPGAGRHPTVCLCHGIPVGKPQPDDKGYEGLAEEFCNAGFSTLTFNFRGTGGSGGYFRLKDWPKDLNAALNFLAERSEVDMERLAVVGFSGGGVVAVYVAAFDQRVKAVAACATPADASTIPLDALRETVKKAKESGSLRGVEKPGSAEELYRDFQVLNPLTYVDRISPRPILIVHGDQDELVNVEEAWKLYFKAKEPKRIVIVKGGQHKLRLNREAVASIIGWLKEVFRPS
ncbi:MAG: alpha/beta fold hydrolase [Candidatus Nezhaarchaeales archaeon]